MIPIYIFDLDGTLADTTHRLRHIEQQPKDWTEFFAACGADDPIRTTIETLRTLREGGAEIWIWTGRSDEVRAETEAWLLEHGCWPPDGFMMRSAGDYRADDLLKAEWLSRAEPSVRARIAGVFEDRGRVVTMWRAQGLTCYQVAAGDF